MEGGAAHGHVLEGLCGFLGPTLLVHQVLGGGSDLLNAGVISEVASKPSDVFDILDILDHFAVFFGCGSIEEVARHWWLGRADPQQYGLCLPELVH